jgi:hypothetical protein
MRRQPLQHLPETWALVDTVSTAHGLVVILIDKGEARTLGVSLDGSSLSLIAVLIGTDICRARGAEIGHRWLQFPNNQLASRVGAVCCPTRIMNRTFNCVS